MTRMVKNFARVVLLCSLITGILCAQEPRPDQPGDPEQSASIPRVSKPPRLEDFEEMQPRGVGQEMVKLTGFIQSEPVDGAAATLPTDVYMGYDPKNLYVIWVCFDDPNKVQAHLTSRESIPEGMDDEVEITIDTFHDRRYGFMLKSNALGVQTDALWAEPGAPDFSFDGVWDSRGRLTSQGYVVEMAIPFRSLRFPQGEKQPAWGFTLTRMIPRNSEWVFWPRVSKRIAGRLNQAAALEGLEGISHSSKMQFIPYVVFRSFRALDNRDLLNPTFDQAKAKFREGLDSKFIFRDSLVLDATVNPDFSQVESDQPQNTVNQRFAVFFPEKRPFFLENSTLFDIPMPFEPDVIFNRLVFTRNIQDPEFGVRLTGKTGPFALAFLATDDRGPGTAALPADGAYRKRAYFAIARVSREIGTQSSVGLIYTDREFFHGWNRIGGIDGSVRLNQNWSMNFRAVQSSTMYLDGTYRAGPYLEAMFIREGLNWEHMVMLQDIGAGFETQVGFVPRNDLRRIWQSGSYKFRPEGRSLLAFGPEVTAEVDYDHNGTLVQYNLSGSLDFEFKRRFFVSPFYQLQVDTLRPKDFPGLARNLTFARNGGGITVMGTPSKLLQFFVDVVDQGGINVVPPKGQMPVLGNELSVEATVTVNPTSRLKIDNTYILDRLTANHGRSAAFNNHIFRSKWTYQFTPKLSLRLIPQYNSLLANPLYTSLQSSKQLNLDFLLTYMVHPGTALYVGYNSNLENLDRSLCARLTTGGCDPSRPGPLRTSNSFINDGRQFFVKLSYVFRP